MLANNIIKENYIIIKINDSNPDETLNFLKKIENEMNDEYVNKICVKIMGNYYNNVKILFDGSMSTIYLLRNIVHDRIDVMKYDKTDYKFCEKEYTTTQCFTDHPGIINTYCVNKKGNILMMEYIDGCDLFEYCIRKEKGHEFNYDTDKLYYFEGVIFEEMISIFIKLAESITCMHLHGYAHGDIKLENILINGDIIKLCDFGFSRKFIDEEGNNIMSNSYSGTFEYASPEILSGKPYDSSKNDVWQFGCVMYILTHLCSPFGTHEEDVDPNTISYKKEYMRSIRKCEETMCIHNGCEECSDVASVFQKILQSIFVIDFEKRPSMNCIVNQLYTIKKTYID